MDGDQEEKQSSSNAVDIAVLKAETKYIKETLLGIQSSIMEINRTGTSGMQEMRGQMQEFREQQKEMFAAIVELKLSIDGKGDEPGFKGRLANVELRQQIAFRVAALLAVPIIGGTLAFIGLLITGRAHITF